MVGLTILEMGHLSFQFLNKSMKTGRPPRPFVKSFHKIPLFSNDGFPFQRIIFYTVYGL